MKYRDHRRYLSESLETIVEIPATKASLVTLFQEKLKGFEGIKEMTQDQITVTDYGFDERIPSPTFIVKLEGWGVMGFTDEPVEISA